MKEIVNYFTLESEYEELEFELSVLPERLLGVDSYLYVGEKINFELKEIQFQIETLYEWELLKAIIVTFETGSITSIEAVRNSFIMSFEEDTREIRKGVYRILQMNRTMYLIEQDNYSIILIGTPSITKDLLLLYYDSNF